MYTHHLFLCDISKHLGVHATSGIGQSKVLTGHIFLFRSKPFEVQFGLFFS